MHRYRYFILFVLGIGVFHACVKEDNFADIPKIDFIGQTKTVLSQGALMEDSLYVKFSFQDGDGDIGDEDSINVFLTDTRQNFANSFRIPDLSSSNSTNLEGEVTMLIFTTCCLYDDNSQAPCTPSTSQPSDEVIFTLQIRDRAGNMSNVIELNPITVMCD